MSASAILIVDDVKKSLEPLARDLRSRGYDVGMCGEADDPVGQFGTNSYELVIVSLDTGSPTGVCDGIRDFPDGAITPVIFIGDGTQSIRSPADALGAGGDYYFAKPLDFGRLAAKVQTYIGAPKPAGAPKTPAKAPPDASKQDPMRLAGAADEILAQIAQREQELVVEQEHARAKEAETARRAAEDAKRAAEDEARRKFEQAGPVLIPPTRKEPDEPGVATRPAAAPEPAPARAASPTPKAPPQVKVPPPIIETADEPTVAPEIINTSEIALKPLATESGLINASYDVAMLLASVLEQGVTGRIDLNMGQRQKTLFVQDGVPVDAYSSQVFDRIEEYLLREGRITRPQYQAARIKRLRSARQVGAFLVTEGHMKPEELFGAVRGHLEELYFSLFEWEEGSFRYTPECADESDRVVLDVSPVALFMEGVRRKCLLPRLINRIGSLSSLLVPVQHRQHIVERLHLSSGEAKVARLLDGTRNIEDLLFSSGLDALRVYHVLFALVALGAAEIKVRGLEGTHGPTDVGADSIDRERIREKADQVRNLDYFQILGLPRSATPYEIERAWERQGQDFSAERFSNQLRDELAGDLDEIAQVLADAKSVLKDDDIREAYARNLG